MVIVEALTNKVSTKWARYSSFTWDNIWLTIIGIAKKERLGLHPFYIEDSLHNPKKCKVNDAMCWFDQNVLQEINPWDLTNLTTLRVRLRIAQGLINNPNMPKNLIPIAQNAMVNIFNQMVKSAWDFRLKYIDELPF